jgi:hypothetical protein
MAEREKVLDQALQQGDYDQMETQLALLPGGKPYRDEE